MTGKGLRVAVLLDRDYCFAWEASMMKRLCESTAADFSLLMLTKPGAPSATYEFWQSLYSRLDRKFFRRSPDAFKRVALEEVCPRVARMSVTLSQEITESDDIKSKNLDVIVDLTEGGMRNRLCGLARLGVWKHRVGVPGQEGNEPGFLELAEKIPILQSSLEIVRSGGTEENILRRSISRMDYVSLGRSRNIAMWRCAGLVSREIEKLVRIGEEEYLKGVESQRVPLRLGGLGSHALPSALASFVAVVRQGWRVAARLLYKLFVVEQWTLAYSFGDALVKPFQSFVGIVPGRDRFWADPHIISRNGEWYIFFEELPFSTRKGHLSVVKLDAQGVLSEPVRILEKPFHLSYPFVFSWDGVDYMIPETSQNRTIELYECKRFPDKWEQKQVLMKGVRAVDATVFFHQSKWWMFANIAEHEGDETLDELFLFYADDFRTNAWTPHPMNPVVSDIRSARPAGKVFEYQGFLIRPSQDCTNGYGSATNLNKIVRLNEQEYEETQLQKVRPSWGKNLIGLHTISVDSGLTVIDLCVKKLKFGFDKNWRKGWIA